MYQIQFAHAGTPDLYAADVTALRAAMIDGTEGGQFINAVVSRDVAGSSIAQARRLTDLEARRALEHDEAELVLVNPRAVAYVATVR